MVEFENSILIERPISVTFAFVADFENMPKWNYFVTQTRKISPGAVGLGTIYHQKRKKDEQELEIIDYEPNHLVAIQTLPPAPSLEMRFTFEPVKGGTRMIEAWKLETGLFGPLEKLASGKVKSAVADNMNKLKKLLETGEVRLQDGRVEQV